MKVNYLNEELLLKLSQIPLKPLSLAEGIYKGYHPSKKSGEEVDFREFRKYVLGDDFKKIDWKRSARQDRFFIREFEQELNYKVHLIIDQSASMGQQVGITKIEYAKYLVSAFTYLFLKQGDQVQISSFSTHFNSFFGFTNNLKQISLLVDELNNLSPKGLSQFSLLIGKTQPVRSEKIIIFIFSDFICESNSLISTLSKLKSPKSKIILFHLVSEEEIDFSFKGEIQFIDPETNESFYCNASQVKDKFLAEWKQFSDQLKRWSQDWEIEYRKLNTQVHYSENLLDFIKSYHFKP